MQSTERVIIIRVAENFLHTGSTVDGEVTVVNLPPGKSSYVEQAGEYGRSIMLEEFRVEGKAIWAGYSARSSKVYLSLPYG
jgi:hypothetical protein